MEKLFCYLLLLLTSSINFAQNDIEVQVQIIVNSDTTYSRSQGPFNIHFYRESDTVKLSTNKDGILHLSSKENPEIIELNKKYLYGVYKGDYFIGEDDFNTFVEGNTRIIREVNQLIFTCGRKIDPITFLNKSTTLSAQGKDAYQIFSDLFHEYENLQVELVSAYNKSSGVELALERTQLIRDAFIDEGIHPDRLITGSPELTDSLNNVGFRILSLDYYPCTGGMVVNFDKTTDTIVETRCDSIHFIYDYIRLQEDNFIVIGIHTDRENPENKKSALSRAELIRKKLIALGINEERLKVSSSYFKPPRKDEHHDWPFYPDKYTYEIGVYIQPDL